MRAPPLRNPPIQDYVDVGVILKALEEMAIEPRVIARHDVDVPHRLQFSSGL